MTKLDDLKAVATEKPLEDGETRMVLSLNDAKEIDAAMHALNRFFGEDESRNAVQLEIQGEKSGYLNRREFCGGQPRVKHGQSQSAELPGVPEFTFIKLACPVEGCETLILKIHYDERDPAMCPVHTEEILKVVA